MLVRVARRRGAGAEAEDVAQEALLRAYLNSEMDLARAGSYLAKIASNLVVDSHRRVSHERRSQRHASLLPRPVAPAELVEDRDLARHAQRLVRQLTPDVQAMVVRRGDGDSWAQIADGSGRRWEAMAMRYHRAISRVRRELEK